MAERKAFNFYASYWQQMKLLKDKQKLELFDTICSVQFLEVNINDISFKDPICTLVWAGIKHSVASSLYGFINKNKGLDNQVIEPLAKGGIEAPYQQEKGKVKEKGEVQYVYNQFYDEQLKLSENDPSYRLFISWLFEDNIYSRPLDAVLKMKEQLSWKQFPNLLKIHKDTGVKIKPSLEDLENWAMKEKKSKDRTIIGTLRTFVNNKHKK